MLYDGKENPSVRERVEHWVQKISTPDQQFRLLCAKVPRQPDEWSCGHRVVLTARLVLQSALLSDSGRLPDKLPEDFASPEKIKGLQKLITSQTALKMETMEGAPPLKRELDEPSSVRSEEPNRKCSRGNDQVKKVPPAVKEVSPPVEEKVAAEPPVSKRRILSKTGARAEEKVVQPASPSKETTPMRRNKKRPLNEDSPAAPEDKRSKNKASKQEKQNDLKNLQIELGTKGLTHNETFQKRHYDSKIPPARGHWQDFFKYIAEGKPFTCPVCRELHMEFVIGHTPVADPIPDEDSEPEEKPSKTKENPEEKPKKVSKTKENPEEKPKKVSRMKSEETGKAGRPVKGSRSHGVLERWILENRPGIYKATKSSDTDYTYFCVPCDKEIRFFRDGVTYVTLHEKGAQHEEGLRCLGLSASGEPVDGRKPCRGVSIDEEKAPLPI